MLFHVNTVHAQISKADIEYQPRQKSSYAPNGLMYVVKKEDNAAVSICQQFNINGILSYCGDEIESSNVTFTLIAESGKSLVTTQTLKGMMDWKQLITQVEAFLIIHVTLVQECLCSFYELCMFDIGMLTLLA